MLILTYHDSQMFQSCQHVLFRVEHFLCRFPDISMRFFWEHSGMFWRANVNLQLIPSVMGGSDRLTEQTVLRLVRKRDELVARGAFLQRRSDKRKRAGSPPLWTTHLSEDLQTWRRTRRHEHKHLHRCQRYSTLRRHMRHNHSSTAHSWPNNF